MDIDRFCKVLLLLKFVFFADLFSEVAVDAFDDVGDAKKFRKKSEFLEFCRFF